MAAEILLLHSAPLHRFHVAGQLGSFRFNDSLLGNKKRKRFQEDSFVLKAMCASYSSSKSQNKHVWIWTEKKEVMTAAVERGWNTFIFPPDRRDLAVEWSSITLLLPLFLEEGGLFDGEHKKVAAFHEISSPQHLEKLQLVNEQAENVVLNLLDWQVIPAENIVAAIQGTQKIVFAISKTPSEAQLFFEALEHGLGGVVLKTEDVKSIFELKAYLDRRNEEGSHLDLSEARVTNIQMVGMGDRVCVDLCNLMKPGEGLLGPVHAYVAVPGGKTSYLSELKAGKEVIVVGQNGRQRTAIVGRVKIESRPLVLVEAKRAEDNQTSYSILLQNAETVALVSCGGERQHAAIPVNSLKLGDEILLRLQGGARHTGIEIEEFIVEK